MPRAKHLGALIIAIGGPAGIVDNREGAVA